MVISQISCPGGTIYTIIPGDTLFALAQRFNTTVQAILNANPGLDPNSLQVGRLICIPVAPGPAPCPGGFLYTIRSGDTFFSIARRFGTTVAALQAANPGVDPNRLQIGQQICVPARAPAPGPCPGGFLYTIRAGDTFFSLASRFGVTVQALTSANPGVNPNNLQVGQQICIPAPAPIQTPATCSGFIYIIRSGDTLFSLAQRFGTTVAAITAANPGINPNQLQVGQQVCIPNR
ncbi:MAG: LysM peptidoglycan-binding domain-containing protein [Firmicutes bacterium]|nr:LysM peptidoglycan-binding domain-containing protein [Bacillota bacterium]